MRFSCGIAIVFVALLLTSSCKEEGTEVVVHNIPEEERFVFETSDPIIYHCSDASEDTVWVRASEFKTNSFEETGFFGTERIYRVDFSKVTLEVTDTTWLTIMHRACPNPEDCSSCLNIQTGVFLYEKPSTSVFFGCDSIGGLIFAQGLVPGEIYLNERTFYNVYSYNYNLSGSEGFMIYWSLKYGIIRFEGEIGETLMTWDLEIPE